MEQAQGPIFLAAAPAGPVEEVDLVLRLRVLVVALQRARAQVVIVAAESKTRVDLAHTFGKYPEQAVRNLVKRADGETRQPEFAAAVRRAAPPLVQWLWKPG